jgi:hypothetical protein
MELSREEIHWTHIRLGQLRNNEGKSLEEARRILEKEAETLPWKEKLTSNA